MVSINAKEERVFVNSILLSYREPLESKALISFNPFLTTPDRELIIVLFFLINSYFFLLKRLRIGKDMWFIIILCLLVAFDGLDLIFCSKRSETLLVQAFADRIHLSGFISRDLRLIHFSTGSLMMHILILLQQVLLQCHGFLGLLLFGSWGGPIASMDRFIVFIDLIFEIGRVHLQLPLRVIGLVWVLEVYAWGIIDRFLICLLWWVGIMNLFDLFHKSVLLFFYDILVYRKTLMLSLTVTSAIAERLGGWLSLSKGCLSAHLNNFSIGWVS